jgi:zinc transporter, ZIP family
MDNSFLIIFGIALLAALASPLGGLLAIWLRPSSLLLSLSVGLAGGVLLGTFAFEMIPKALEMVAIPWVVAGFAVGFAEIELPAEDTHFHRPLWVGVEVTGREEYRKINMRNARQSVKQL